MLLLPDRPETWTHHNTTVPSTPSPLDDFSFLQLNCHISKEITLTLLHHLPKNIIFILQEPWVNPFTLSPPIHPNWHMLASYDHNPRDWRDQHKCCVYVHKSIPSKAILQLPCGSKHVMGVTIKGACGKLFLVINVYNLPGTNAGLKDLHCLLPGIHHIFVPTCIFMDANLHHWMWNPPGYLSTHKRSINLITLCGKNGFKLASPWHIPTFYLIKGKGTTIDLIWANHQASKILAGVHVLDENFGSDHQALKGTLCVKGFPPAVRWAKSIWNNIDQTEICKKLGIHLEDGMKGNNIEDEAEHLTASLQLTQDGLGRNVQENEACLKSWWDPGVLNPVLNTRNRVRQLMMLAKTKEASQCYKEWNKYFQSLVSYAKLTNWRKYLESSNRDFAFNALSCIQPVSSGQILPLKRADGSFAVWKAKQAKMLFEGTSLLSPHIDLSDVSKIEECRPAIFEKISKDKVCRALNKLAVRKAPGPDRILNKNLKLTSPVLQTHLVSLYNKILHKGKYPSCWKRATTAIIRKSNKASYTVPNGYHPIALLNTLGKVLELIIARRLVKWAVSSGYLSNRHYGGRKGVGTKDAIYQLDSWVRDQWTEKKVVVDLFLDVQSAYPTFHPDQLINILVAKKCPAYLWIFFRDFLRGRNTTMRLDN